VNSQVARHWDNKIARGLIPSEALLQGNVDSELHDNEYQRLVDFEAFHVAKILNNMAGNECLRYKQLHYFGVGLSLALKEVTILANSKGMQVVAYDVSRLGNSNATAVFQELEPSPDLPFSNVSYQADITFACQDRFIDPAYTRLIVAPRILDVIAPGKSMSCTDAQTKAAKERKLRKTATRLGAMLDFLKVFLIHPCPEGNENAVFKDTTLYPLSLISGCMETGLGAQVRMSILGRVEFYRHLYTGVLFEKS
jgi:hypothetical protein